MSAPILRMSVTHTLEAFARRKSSTGGVWLCRVLLMLSLAGVPGIPELCAQVDQDHWVPNGMNNTFNSILDLQQEFTPALSSMDSAEFSIGQGFMGISWPLGGSVFLNIRQGGVDGPIIAVSSTIAVPGNFHGDIVFRFPQPVTLVPGQVYAMEPFSPTQLQVMLDANRLGVTPSYDRGRLFYNGKFESVDLLFREGIGLVPEPPPVLLEALAFIGAALVFGKHWRRPLVNHNGPANGSQPIGSQTNATSSAASPRR